MSLVNFLKFITVIGTVIITSCNLEANILDKEQRLNISVENRLENGDIMINVQLSIFVNCGSQYAIWDQFPTTTLFTLKDIDTGIIYKSVDDVLSISWDGNEVYDHYGKEPCDKIVTENFSIALSEIYFREETKTPVVNFELDAYYLGLQSNLLVINDASVPSKS